MTDSSENFINFNSTMTLKEARSRNYKPGLVKRNKRLIQPRSDKCLYAHAFVYIQGHVN